MRRLAWLALAALLTAGLAGSCGGGGSGGSGGPTVLILDNDWPDRVADLRDKLRAYAVFSRVDVIDPGFLTPSLRVLESYDAVLVVANSGFANPTQLGNTMADYVDDGGGLVLAEFFLSSLANTLEGRFAADDYYLIPRLPGYRAGDGPFGLRVVIPDHPILTGVSTFSGGPGSARPLGAVVSSAYDLVATWKDADTTPLIAAGRFGVARRVDLGLYPVTSDVSVESGMDPKGMLIVANALRWVARDL